MSATEQTKKEIIEAYIFLREKNHSIPSDTLSFMKDAALEKLNNHNASPMPTKLTAENGAKALLIGEFHETIVTHDDNGEPYEIKMPIEWDTIKEIYKKIVENYAEPCKEQ